MAESAEPSVSELLGHAFAAGYLDREALDDFDSFDFDEVLDNITTVIVEHGDNPHTILKEWNIIE